MPGSYLGHSVLRVEDPQLVTGAAHYSGDVSIETDASGSALAHAVFVTAPLAPARIAALDLTPARTMPGVIGVFTNDDFPHIPAVPTMPGLVADSMARPLLASERVRFVGEAIALVVGDTLRAAEDAAEAVMASLELDPEPAVVDPIAALEADAPVVFADRGAADNVASRHEFPPIDDLFADADVVVQQRIVNQRIAVVPMEGWSVTVVPDGGPRADGTAGRTLVYGSSQAPHGMRDSFAGRSGVDPKDVRVISHWVGGGFGAKNSDLQGQAVFDIARRLGRPIRWVQPRSENVATMHGRAQVQDIELGARRDGTITGLRARIVADAGAYPGINCYLPILTRKMASGTYRIPKIDCTTLSVATHTAPLSAYRGAGRPEAAAFVERIVDVLAAELGIDPVELRRKNFIAPHEFPYDTPTDARYDVGEYERSLDEALRLADYAGLRAEQAKRRATNTSKLLGIGVACYVEITAGMGLTDFGHVAVMPDAHAPAGVRVIATAGTSSHGQGHASAYAQVVATVLGVPFESVEVVESDTDRVAWGVGTFASRSVLHRASEDVVTKARELTAQLLEASVDDIVQMDDGRFGVAGVPAQAKSWAELAQAAAAASTSGANDAESALQATGQFAQEHPTYPFGAHVAVVEVDRETGEVRLIRHIAVDDCGQRINPLLVNGQVHGGIAQGAAQALFEEIVYDESGQIRTGNLMDYAMPSAAELPSFECAQTETPTPLNPLGAKGIGESGSIGSTPAVHNAVVDALAHLGVRHIDMPCTPEKVWRAINGSGSGSGTASRG